MTPGGTVAGSIVLSLITALAILDNITGPFTVVIVLINGRHSQDQLNENGFLPQNNYVTNQPVKYMHCDISSM